MRNALRALALLAAGAILLAPALWNRFPLLQYDTGGYLARWFEGYLVLSRSTVYGLFAVWSWPWHFWPALVLQAAATLWVLALMLRIYARSRSVLALLAVVAGLALVTTLPWLSAILLTDIFAGLGVLAAHLLIFRGAELSRAEQIGLVAFVGFCAATHTATAAVLAVMPLLALAAAAFMRGRGLLAGAGRGAAALVLGTAMLLATNFALSKRIAWTSGGYGIVFARMLQDGIVQRFLADHCPDPRFRLCAHQSELPRSADAFLWGNSVFDRLGRFAGLSGEMQTIVLESLRAYPLLQLKAAVTDTAMQLVRVRTGEGVVNDIGHTYSIVERYMPEVVPAMRAARQQQGTLGPQTFRAVNWINVPAGLAALALMPLLALLGWRRRLPGDLGWLAANLTLVYLANATICGVLSNPHDRYGARLIWLPPLVATLAALRWRAAARAARPQPERAPAAPSQPASAPTLSPTSRSSVA